MRTSWPAAKRSSTTYEPRKPAPPVTRVLNAATADRSRDGLHPYTSDSSGRLGREMSHGAHARPRSTSPTGIASGLSPLHNVGRRPDTQRRKSQTGGMRTTMFEPGREGDER